MGTSLLKPEEAYTHTFSSGIKVTPKSRIDARPVQRHGWCRLPHLLQSSQCQPRPLSSPPSCLGACIPRCGNSDLGTGWFLWRKEPDSSSHKQNWKTLAGKFHSWTWSSRYLILFFVLGPFATITEHSPQRKKTINSSNYSAKTKTRAHFKK